MTNKNKIDFSNYVYQPTYLYSDLSQSSGYSNSQPQSYTSEESSNIFRQYQKPINRHSEFL